MISAVHENLFAAPLIALGASSISVAFMIHTRMAAFALDHPNQRSLHERPIPRLGGVGIVLGTALAWWYFEAALDARLLLALVWLIFISLIDDFKGVPVTLRFAVHLLSAAFGVLAVWPASAPWMTLVALLATAWMTNLYNFMDGSDGLAGGMAVAGFGAYGVAALLAGDAAFAALNLSVAAATLGFLLFNFPPARIFMGDAGAIPLGFLAAIFNLMGAQRGDWPLWLGLVVFSPFAVDASVTLAKRALRGAKVWTAHREHYYQRLVQHGWGHRRTALTEYALMAACAVVAIFAVRLDAAAQAATLGAMVATYAALIFALERALPPVAADHHG